MDRLRDSLGVRRIDTMTTGHIKELRNQKKDVDERIDKSVLRWVWYFETIQNNKIARSVYECVYKKTSIWLTYR